GTWEAPPVRGAVEEPSPSATTDTPPAPMALETPAPSRAARRRALLVLGSIAGLVAAGGVALWLIVESSRAGSEAERFRQVQELYGKEDFAEANEALLKLMNEFPDSADMRKYQLLAELSSVRAASYEARTPGALTDALDRVLQFVGINAQQPMLKEYHADI